MAELRARGLRLHEIAERYGISGARVGQILQSHGGPDTRQADAARRQRAEEDATARIDELLALWRSGTPLVVAAKELGLDPPACATAIARVATDADRASRRANMAQVRVSPRTYSDHDIHDAMIYVAVRFGETPSLKQYAAVARERGFPSRTTVLNRMGSWSNAIASAGLTPGPTARSATRRWTQEACWDAVHTILEEAGEIPSVRTYDRLASGRDDLPSSVTIRKRLGPWSAVIRRLALDSTRLAQPANPDGPSL
jgi:transcriptional regulator with XRE-family HTH domain